MVFYNLAELQHLRNSLPDEVVVQRIEERLSALGNCIACNDHVALAHTDLDKVKDVTKHISCFSVLKCFCHYYQEMVKDYIICSLTVTASPLNDFIISWLTYAFWFLCWFSWIDRKLRKS